MEENLIKTFNILGVSGTISKFGHFPKMHLSAGNSAQNNHPRLVTCSFEAQFDYLNDEGKMFFKILISQGSGAQFLFLDTSCNIHLFA